MNVCDYRSLVSATRIRCDHLRWSRDGGGGAGRQQRLSSTKCRSHTQRTSWPTATARRTPNRSPASCALSRRASSRRLPFAGAWNSADSTTAGWLASTRYRSIFSVRMRCKSRCKRRKSRLLNAAQREVSDGEVLGPTEALPPDSTGASEVPRPSQAMSPETNGVKAGH